VRGAVVLAALQPAHEVPAGQGSGRFHTAGMPAASGPMSRSYTGWSGNGDLICPARKQQEGARVLCVDVYGSSDGNGTTTITADICNVGTATETVSYATARELDVAVRQGNREVWRWSTGRRFGATPHEASVPIGECLTWTTSWSQVDVHGVPVAKGTYDVTADFDAEQLPAPDRHSSYSMTLY
ncbi:MAG: hypothetical protein JWP11_488, partial [Frankiales bacterium]|nr:hypothetical protein [Frankiales bacterium]